MSVCPTSGERTDRPPGEWVCPWCGNPVVVAGGVWNRHNGDTPK